MNFVDFIKQHFGVTPQLTDRYGEWLGYSIADIDLDKNTVTTTLTVRDDHLSPSGAVHGGVISGFLDFSCGCAVFITLEKGQLCSTVELNVKYFKPLRSGDQIVAVSELVNRGNSLCSVLSKMYKTNDLNTPIALATGTFNIYKYKASV